MAKNKFLNTTLEKLDAMYIPREIIEQLCALVCSKTLSKEQKNKYAELLNKTDMDEIEKKLFIIALNGKYPDEENYDATQYEYIKTAVMYEISIDISTL